MKKILVVLLILAVAGGVFAQEGSWSISGGMVVGTRIDFDPDPEQDTNDPALVDGIGYFDWQPINGALNIGYNKDSINVSLTFATNESGADVSFDGENFKGQIKVDGFNSLVQNWGHTSADGGRGAISRLWGEFKFFDGIVTLLPAFASPDTEYWVSDKTGTFKDKVAAGGSNPWKRLDSPFGGGDTFTKVDHHNYLLAGAEVGGLNFGVQIHNLFAPSNGAWGWQKQTGNTNSNLFVDGVLKQMILGLSFSQSPFEFAAQFKLANYGVYFGGKFFAGPITVGFSAEGILDGDGASLTGKDGTVIANDADPQQVKIGGKVEYAGDDFGGGLSGFYEKKDLGMETKARSDWYLSTVGIEPFFYYAAIPSHLMFRLDVGFYFFNDTDGNTSDKATVWALQPQLFWNFLGTGATDSWWGGFNTGIVIRYRLANADTRDLTHFGGTANNSVNFADVIFKLSF